MNSDDLVSPIECPPSWTLVSLRSICKKIGSGATPKGGQAAYQKTRTKFALVRSQNVFDREFSEAGLAFISDEQADSLRGVRLEKNDILLNITGDGVTFGRACLVPAKALPACVNQHVSIIRLDSQQADSGYVVSYLTHPTIKSYIESFNAGGSRRAITKAHIESFVVPLPPLATQRAIAGLLGALDDRITLLRETNITLEAIAQALFKSWFVDFDPVRAKMEGRTPEGMDEATAALFPDGFEMSELGEVPRGWRVGCIDDICSTVTNGGTPSRSKTEYWEQGTIPWFKTGEFHDGFLLQPSERITNAALIGSSVKLLPKDAVLMAIYAAPTVGRLGILVEPATFNQACTGMVARNEVGPWFLFWTLFNGRDWFNSRANGAAQQNISKAIVSAYRTVIPPNPVLDSFNLVASGIHEAIRMNTEKAMTLSTLRDTLLPRLISGQLRLPEAQNELMCAIG